MSDTIVDSQGKPVEQEQTNNPNTEEPQPISMKDISCGYTVALKKDGDFVFDIFGDDPGLIQLLGLHQFAELRISVVRDTNQRAGFPVVVDQLNRIGQMMHTVLNMLTQQSKNNLTNK